MPPKVHRMCFAAVVGVLGALAWAAPAVAHADVQVEPAMAGAANALVTVVAEAESPDAGVIGVQVVLPAGISPADVTLVSAPAGWSLTGAADGYAVGGAALQPGVDPRHQIRVRQLPQAGVIYFKVLTRYADGSVDRWIEIPSAANPSPANPAAAVPLAGYTSPQRPPGVAGGNGRSGWWVVLAGAALVVAVTGGLLLAYRRAGSS